MIRKPLNRVSDVRQFLQAFSVTESSGRKGTDLTALFSGYTFRVLTAWMFGCSEKMVIRSWYWVLPRMESVYTFV